MKSALIIAVLAGLIAADPANADIPGPMPYCGDEAAKSSPSCIANDGDIPAQAFQGEWQKCPENVAAEFEGMNCVFLEADEHLTGKELLDASRALFGDGNAVAVKHGLVPETLADCGTAFCSAAKVTAWQEEWWHGGNHNRDDADRGGRTGERDVAVNDPPARSEPPAARGPERSEPPARSDPPRCD